MNKIATVSALAVLTAFAGAPQTAQARDDKVLAAIGGFIGGVLIASHANQHHPSHQIAYCEFDSCGDRYVVNHRHDRGYGRDQHYGRDRYDWVTVRTWVPGHWVVRYDDCGDRVRYYERGRYEYRREYVVVDSHRGRGQGHGRRG